MVNTLQEALNYFYFTAFFFGFGILRHPLNNPRISLSILYILCVWSTYVYFLYYVLIIMSGISTYIVFCFYIITNLFVTTITIIITICKHKNISVLMNKLSQVDDTLEELGTPKEYRRLRNLTICIIIIWFIMICIMLTTNFICYNQCQNRTKAILLSIIINYSYVINILVDIMVMFLLRYIGTRYDKINNYIKQLSETEECGLRYTWKKSSLVTRFYIRNKVNRKRILWTAMHLHWQLSRLALNINNLFQIQMTLQIMSYFVTLTTMFYFQYPKLLRLMNGSKSWEFLFCSNLFGVFDIIRVISLNNICENINAKAQKTKSIIHKLTNIICFANAREEICHFVLQISLRPLKFSGMGLFYFGHKFLWKFSIWIISIIILIIQINEPIFQINSNRKNVTCVTCSKMEKTCTYS